MSLDFTKGYSREVNIPQLIENKNLDFKFSGYCSTGELDKSKVAKYRGMEFTVYENFFRISGSLHKFKNNGKHNYDDFTYTEIVEVISELEELLKLHGSKIVLENLEFAVNLITNWRVSEILDSLICFSTTEFGKIPLKSGNAKVAILSDYRLKAYHKLGLLDELFRWEVHINKMRHIEATGIRTFEDLKNKDKLMMLKPILLEKWSKSLLFDWTIDEVKGVEVLGAQKFYKMQNFPYWQGLNNKQRYKQRNRYEKRLVTPFSERVQYQVEQEIADKFEFLMSN